MLTTFGIFIFIWICKSKTLSIENNRLVWDYAGSLPAQKGFDKNIGTAGLLQGIIGDYIVVGGGANFPEALEKGEKSYT